MAENARKRKSKWDVVAETHYQTEIANDRALPVKVDDSVKDQESISDMNPDSVKAQESISDLNPSYSNSMLYKDSSEAYQSSTLSGMEAEGTKVGQDCPVMLQFSECSNMEAGNADGSKRSCWEPTSGNQITSNDGNRFPSPTDPDVEVSDKDGSKRSLWEPNSVNQSTTKDDTITGGRENLNTEKSDSCLDGQGQQNTTKEGGATDGRGTAVKKYRKSSSPGFDAIRQRGRSNSPRSVRSTSHMDRSRSRSRSRSKSRSRSPFYGSRREPQRWGDRGRMGVCRDFSAGRCRRGRDCRFIHEDGGRKHSDSRDSGYERGRHSGHDNKENSGDSREQRDYSRDRPSQRHGGHYDGGREKSELHRNNRSSDVCYDFTQGRCHRGSSCRYIHHASSSDVGWRSKDDARERSRDRRDADASSLRRPDTHRTPCKYFAEGRCRWSEGCKFSHQDGPRGPSDSRPQDDMLDRSMETDYSSSRTSLNLGDQAATMDQTDSSPWVADKNSSQHLESQNPQGNVVASQVMDEIANSAISQAEMDPVNTPFTVTGVPIEKYNQSAVPHPLPVQGFPPNVQLQQAVPPMPFNGPMHQAYPLPPPNGQHQFIAPHPPPNPQIFNIGFQSQPFLTPPHNTPNQQNYNLSGQTQGIPAPHNAQNQPNFHHIGQIHQGLPLPYSGPGQQIHLPQNGQNHYGAPQQVPNPQQSFNSGVKDPIQNPGMTEIKPSQPSTETPVTHKVVTSEQAAQISNLTTSLAQFFGNGPPLPQLYAALNPQPPMQPFPNPGAGVASPYPQPSQGSLTQPLPDPISDSNAPPGFSSPSIKQKDPKQEKPRDPLSATGETNDGNEENDKPKQIEIELSSGIGSKEMNDTETEGQSKREKIAHSEEVDADVRTDGVGKKGKDEKGSRMFKCALVEFVKDTLKPAWKEGHLSKEVHKTIVKKVVDKVTGAMQSSNIPQTQEKIDVYMAYAKAKLTKLVQAYLEKYV